MVKFSIVWDYTATRRINSSIRKWQNEQWSFLTVELNSLTNK